MSYLARILPPEEWPRLAGTDAETVWPHMNPLNTRVLVVEEDGRIVGVWLAMRMIHAECVWIDEAHRHRPGIVRRLVRGMQRIAQGWGVRVVLTHATTDAVRRLSQKLGGVEVPGTAYALPMPYTQEEQPCQQS